MKGFVNICKPSGMTSSDVVVKVRGILRHAIGEKQKTGHLGTLDPLATGVLPIAIGNATRLFDYMLEKTKTYIATFKFGLTTDTLDSGGAFIEDDSQNTQKIISKNDIISVIPKLIGEIDQMPPQYSAKSINGRKAYDIAREGGFADLKPKKINIYDISLLGGCDDIIDSEIALLAVQNKPLKLNMALTVNEYSFKITCNSGTYIRAIARDMASELGTVGYMTSLCRIQTGGFDIENAVNLEDFQLNPLKYVLPLETALKSYDIVDLDENQGAKALNGVKIACDKPVKSPFVVKVCGDLVGLGEIVQGYLSIKTRL